jgi:hypothetical protein
MARTADSSSSRLAKPSSHFGGMPAPAIPLRTPRSISRPRLRRLKRRGIRDGAASRRLLSMVPRCRAPANTGQATGDFIRVIVSTDVTATPSRGVWTRCPSDHTNRDVPGIVGATSLEWHGDVRRLAGTLAWRSPEPIGGSPSCSPEGNCLVARAASQRGANAATRN